MATHRIANVKSLAVLAGVAALIFAAGVAQVCGCWRIDDAEERIKTIKAWTEGHTPIYETPVLCTLENVDFSATPGTILHAALIERKQKIEVLGVVFERFRVPADDNNEGTVYYVPAEAESHGKAVKLSWLKNAAGVYKRISISTRNHPPSDDASAPYPADLGEE